MSNIENILDKMSPEEIKAMESSIIARRKAEKEKYLGDLQALEQSEDELVGEIIAEAEPLSNAIVDFKRKWIERIKTLVDLKISLGKARPDQEQYQFKKRDGSGNVAVRYNRTDRYDDGINVGIGYAKEWLSNQADTDKTKQLVSIIDDLLSKDSKGNFSPADLLKFIKNAEEIGDDLLLKAAEAVKNSIYEEATSVSLLVFKKDEIGVKRQLPLSATKA